MAYKVIQWATGSIGKTTLRQVIDHPDLELVGLYVYSRSKVGRDAGDIARRPRTGVIATDSIEDILALQADVVLYVPLNPSDTLDQHDETIRRLLRSSKHVITTIAHTFPASQGQDYVEKFAAACREGKSVLFGTGINPGFIAERIAVTLSGVCTQLDRISVTEVYDVSIVQSPGFIFELMGVGKPESVIRNEPRVQRIFQHIFGEVVHYIGHALKVEFDEIVPDHEFGITPKDIRLAAGEVTAGGVVNFRWRWRGMRGGKPFFTIQMLWIGDRSLPGWDHADGWQIDIEGAPGIKARIDLIEPQGLPDRSRAIQYAVAGPVIRAIPEVMKAPPGVLVPPTFAPYTFRM